MPLSKRFQNPGVVAGGMLAPSGYAETKPDPFIQSTTRPAGTLLQESPGYDSIRPGKNRFQGKGPTGGFRLMAFAEDIGGSGSAVAIIPGDTATLPASEWLPEDTDSLPEGSFVVADRNGSPEGTATRLHEGIGTLVDMGDRDVTRPLSKFLVNPAGALRDDWQRSPVATILGAIAAVWVLNRLATDAERSYRGYRGRGIASNVTAVPAAAAAGSGEAAGDAVNQVGDAADRAVEKINAAVDSAVSKIEHAASSAPGE